MGGGVGERAKGPAETSGLFGKVALPDSIEDPLKTSPLFSKVALADSVEDPLEASPLCSKVALTDSGGDSLPRNILDHGKAGGISFSSKYFLVAGDALPNTILCKN